MIWKVYFLTMNGEYEKASTESESCRTLVDGKNYADVETFYGATMALLELKKGNYDKAIELFAKANTTDPYDLYYWAQAYQKKGEQEKARQILEKVTRLNINNMALAIVRKRALDEINQL